eukprot:9089715-Alexandrium_andersonii.AAC.2
MLAPRPAQEWRATCARGSSGAAWLLPWSLGFAVARSACPLWRARCAQAARCGARRAVLRCAAPAPDLQSSVACHGPCWH